MPAALALIAAGLLFLYFAGEHLVSFASAIAEKSGISPSVVGLTVVAAGTSMPEFFVSLLAAAEGRPDIAAGNVIGSNIANLTLVLGATALVRQIRVESRLLRIDYPFLLLSAWIMVLLCRDGLLDRMEGGFALFAAVAFMAWSVAAVTRIAGREEKRDAASIVPEDAADLRRRGYALLSCGVLACVAGLSLGSRLLVSGATTVAVIFGMSDRVIGLTVVAIGTSLPELTASVLAARRGHQEMAIANLVGSNVFNLLLIMGACGLIRPLSLSGGLAGRDLWAMLGVTAVLAPLIYLRRGISRPAGAVLLAAFFVYNAFFVLR